MKMRFLALTLILTGGLFSMANSSEIAKIQFDNGLTLIHKKTGPLPIISVKLFLKTGCTNDPKEKLGLTNLTQQLLTRGTKTRTNEQIATEIESMGGHLSASCVEDYSEIDLDITQKYFTKAFDLLADVFLNPSFPADELEKAKTVTKASIRSRQDSIFEVTFDLLKKNLYQDHPYTNIPSGTLETVDKITQNDLVAYHKKYYGSQNILMVVTGNISLAEIKKAINKSFAGLSKGETPVTTLPIVTAQQKTEEQKGKFEQAYLMYGFLVPEISNNDYTKLKVLNTYLGGGMSSLLFQELREKAGLGYEVSSFYPSRKAQSSFVIYIGLDKSSLTLAKEKVNTILNELKTRPIDEARLKDAKKYIKGTFLLDHQTNSRQCWYLGWWETIGKGYKYDDVYASELEKITSADIKEVINKYFSGNYVYVQISPEK
ncbi:MAG: hypothetical protein A2252_06590 [Elusimicrobia bacterium RIFOXYA2_FULL_39_19]|nr:MAG: hypothetical protein A2252_06590 [Elusimicrobia bacterium RIFOXYA2_FULL_39_19]